MNMKLIGAVMAIALLAGCASKNTATTSGSGAAAVSSGPAPGSQEDLMANVGDRVFFAFDLSAIRGPGADAGPAGRLARQVPQVNVQISGNCDDRGTEEYNIALGQRRANAARDYLVAKGVASARMTTISYGKDRPVALGDNEAAWAQNRNAITEVK